MTLELILYLTVGMVAYAISGNNTPQMLTQLTPLYQGWWAFQIPMTLAIVLIIFHLLFANPLQLMVTRRITINPKDEKYNGFWFRFVFAFLVMGLSSLIACYLSDVVVVFSVVGGFASCFIMVFFPGISISVLIFKENKRQALFISFFSLIVVATGLVAASLGVLTTLKFINIGI